MEIAVFHSKMFFQRMLHVASDGATAPRCLHPSGSNIRRRGLLGLALTEVLVGIAIITITSATAMWALGAANRLATVNRNFTGAKTVLQNKIDEVLSVNYRVTAIPAVLNTGTTTEAVTVNPGPPAINGTLTTTVSVADAALNIRQVKATLAYPYNGRIYSLSMSTARSPD
jgi:type II secretory pathway pseudopilin PulG